MAIISLTTDFGATDTYVGAMKGVILGIAPDAAIVDLCHDIPPQDILAGALAIESAIDYFPARTIHVGVVDPRVGSDRAAIAVQTERFILVGPDNGLFTLALAKNHAVSAVRLTNSDFHNNPVSATFHGRDIFASVAAHLARGAALKDLGEPQASFCCLNIPAPKVVEQEMELSVLRKDHFGNLITNLTFVQYVNWLRTETAGTIRLEVGNALISGISRTYADVDTGQLVAYFGSSGRLEIAVRNGSAADHLRANPGQFITLRKM